MKVLLLVPIVLLIIMFILPLPVIAMYYLFEGISAEYTTHNSLMTKNSKHPSAVHDSTTGNEIVH